MSEQWVSRGKVATRHVEYDGQLLHKPQGDKPMFPNSTKRKCKRCMQCLTMIHEVGYAAWNTARLQNIADATILGWKTKAKRDKLAHKYVAPTMMRLVPVTCPACGRSGAVPNKTKPTHHCTMCGREVTLA